MKQLNGLYRTLIDAENRHDEPAVRKLLWESPNMLFVAKTATAAEGNWAGFWGTDVVMQHLHDLYQGSFVMAPDYARVKTVALSADVAETYTPLNISVRYAGQTPVPKPFSDDRHMGPYLGRLEDGDRHRAADTAAAGAALTNWIPRWPGWPPRSGQSRWRGRRASARLARQSELKPTHP